MRIMRLFQLFLLAAAVTSASAATAPHLELLLDAPASLADLQPLVVHFTLTNAGHDAITVPEPVFLRNTRIDVTPLQVARTSRCSAHITYDGVITTGIPVRTLAAGTTVSADGDLAAAWPFGLVPGRYRLVATYTHDTGSVRSAPVELTVTEPAGSATYEQMMEVCSALQQHAPDAAERAVAFVTGHGDFPYQAALLDYARHNSRGADRTMLSNVLIDRYSSTPEAVTARRERADADRHHAAVASREEYDARYAAELAKLPIAQRVEISNALATIRDADDFTRVEQFLSRNQGTFFGAEALHVMIEAVGRGVLPPGTSSQDRDHVINDLTGRLQHEYPESYWSQRMR